MKGLMMNDKFSDVTLVTEDKKHIKANIFILSTCSLVFRDIFLKNRNSNPIIYLRGVQYSELEPIIQFIYLGEASFYEERMDEFLAVAKSLEITQLDEFVVKSSSCGPVTSISKLEKQSVVSDPQKMQAPQEAQRKVVDGHKYICDQCDYKANRRDGLIGHIQSKHEDIKYVCDQCDYQATQRSALATHIQIKHEGVKYACNQCDYQTGYQSELSNHTQSKHEGVKFSCTQCDYQASRKDTLSSHIQSKHEGVVYDCTKCEYKATRPSSFREHIKFKHDDVRVLGCNQCEYKAYRNYTLKAHIQSKHDNQKKSEPYKINNQLNI